MGLTETWVASPLGHLLVVRGPRGIVAVGFENEEERLRTGLHRRFGSDLTLCERRDLQARRALDEYFGGDFDALLRVDVDPGGTEFQGSVWNALRRIPAGRTRSYSQLAATVQRPRACRAVGMANARNPIPIVIPCHRVIAADGKLGGFSSGLARKEWLLAHEGVGLPRSTATA